jgi:hypothetical protein
VAKAEQKTEQALVAQADAVLRRPPPAATPGEPDVPVLTQVVEDAVPMRRPTFDAAALEALARELERAVLERLGPEVDRVIEEKLARTLSTVLGQALDGVRSELTGSVTQMVREAVAASVAHALGHAKAK